jgi:hypothetical protein
MPQATARLTGVPSQRKGEFLDIPLTGHQSAATDPDVIMETSYEPMVAVVDGMLAPDEFAKDHVRESEIDRFGRPQTKSHNFGFPEYRNAGIPSPLDRSCYPSEPTASSSQEYPCQYARSGVT